MNNPKITPVCGWYLEIRVSYFNNVLFYLRAHKKRNLKLISEDKLVPATLLCSTSWHPEPSHSGANSLSQLSTPHFLSLLHAQGHAIPPSGNSPSLPPPLAKIYHLPRSDSRSFHFRKLPRNSDPREEVAVQGGEWGRSGWTQASTGLFIHSLDRYLSNLALGRHGTWVHCILACSHGLASWGSLPLMYLRLKRYLNKLWGQLDFVASPKLSKLGFWNQMSLDFASVTDFPYGFRQDLSFWTCFFICKLGSSIYLTGSLWGLKEMISSSMTNLPLFPWDFPDFSPDSPAS